MEFEISIVVVFFWLLWFVCGSFALCRLFLKKSVRETAFSIRPDSAAILGIAAILIYIGVAFLVGSFLNSRGVDRMYAGIAGTFAMQLSMILFCFVAAKFTIASKPRFIAPAGGVGNPTAGLFLQFFKGVGYVVATLGVVGVLLFLWNLFLHIIGFDVSSQDIIEIFMATHTPLYRVLLILSLVLLAPIWEELFFRVGLYGALKRHIGFIPAAIASGVIFGAIHMSFSALLPLCFLGIFFAVLYEKYGDIRVAIGAHAAFNSLNVIILTYAPHIFDN